MKRLTTNEHWDSGYSGVLSRARMMLTSLSRYSYYYYDFIEIIDPYMKKKTGGKIMEVGCAPGNHLVLLAKRYRMEPFGIEYARHGVNLTRENFARHGYNPENVIHADFFDRKFHKKHAGKYEVVMSFGFIEHFDNPAKVVKLHADMLKKDGILIITVPNFSGLNRILAKKETLDRHNLSIMSAKALEELVPEGVEVKEAGYFGGLFNTGLFSFRNKIAEAVRLALFAFQRALIDPLMIVAREAGLNPNCKKSSPSLILVAVKNARRK